MPHDRDAEIATLAQRFGEPARISAGVNGKEYFVGERTEEVCMAIRRPNGLLITVRKEFYPEQTYRLPTGGIEEGESIEEALLREVHEETGLEVGIVRFLAAIGYRPEGTDQPDAFRTYAFLLEETGGTLGALDPDERVAGFQEVAPFELLAVTDHLEHLHATEAEDLGERWDEWGRFRSIAHRVVYGALVEADVTPG